MSETSSALWFIAMVVSSAFVVVLGYHVDLWLAIVAWLVLTWLLLALRPQ